MKIAIKKPHLPVRKIWWSVGGSNLQAIAEHVEMKGGKHAISFHPTTHPTTLCVIPLLMIFNNS